MAQAVKKLGEGATCWSSRCLVPGHANPPKGVRILVGKGISTNVRRLRAAQARCVGTALRAFAHPTLAERHTWLRSSLCLQRASHYRAYHQRQHERACDSLGRGQSHGPDGLGHRRSSDVDDVAPGKAYRLTEQMVRGRCIL